MITHWVLLCVYYYVSSANIKPVRVFPLRYNYTPSTIATPRLFPSPQIKLTQKDESYPIAPPTHLLFMKKKKKILNQYYTASTLLFYVINFTTYLKLSQIIRITDRFFTTYNTMILYTLVLRLLCQVFDSGLCFTSHPVLLFNIAATCKIYITMFLDF